MNTHNDVMKKGKIFCGLRSITLLAVAMLAASVAVTGCSKPDSSDGRTSGGNTIKCGTATCNKLTQKCENDRCVPKMPSTVPCGTSSCNAATQECVDGNKCVNKCGDTVCSDTQNCVGGQCVTKGGTTPCGSTTCDDDTQECKNNTCVTRTIECGMGANRRPCIAATQECRDGTCAAKGSEVTCDPDFQVKQGDVCVIKNAGDGTCDSSPCTGSDICQSGTCVSVCKFCDESANYVGCFSKTIPCEYDTDSGKYMAVNRSTNPPTKTECKNPVCGRKTTRDSQGNSPCYTPQGDCAKGLECVQLGSNTYQCAKVPQIKLPCGGTCQNGETCNETSNQCESSPAHTVPTCDDSVVVAPPDVTPLTFTPDAASGKSYRSVATVTTTIGRHSANIGAFEKAMNTCGSAQTTNTDYQVFLVHLDTYSKIGVYSDPEDEQGRYDGFSAALFNTNKCSSAKICDSEFLIAKSYKDDAQVKANILPSGDYYLIVKNSDLSNAAAQGKSWTLKVVKEDYEAQGGCTGPEQVGIQHTCDTNKKAYTKKCFTNGVSIPPAFQPAKIGCLTSNTEISQQGCYRESSSALNCYGLTCEHPITIDGSSSKTVTFAEPPSSLASASAYNNVTSFTNNTCVPAVQPTTRLQYTYVLKVTNLKTNSKVTIRIPPTGVTPPDPSLPPLLSGSAAVVRFQSSCGGGETCLNAQSFEDGEPPGPTKPSAEFSYPQNDSASTPTTLYITVTTSFFFFSSDMPRGFDLIIGQK